LVASFRSQGNIEVPHLCHMTR